MSDQEGAMGEWGNNSTPKNDATVCSGDSDEDEGYAPELTETSCPWCLYPKEQFVERDNGKIGCKNCSAVIPVDADWYQRGEKIIV